MRKFVFVLIFSLATCTFSQNLVDIASQFVGTPYVAKTLDRNHNETLFVSMHEVDCQTFVETAVALWRAEGDTTKLASEVQTLRYRNGKIDGYASRLHYTTDWIADNVSRGIFRDITNDLGGQISQKNINFMSSYAAYYPQLKTDSTLVEQIRHTEQRLSSSERYIIAKSDVEKIEKSIPEGAIIVIESTIKGLDFAHMGFAVKRNGHTHLLHASSTHKKVCISELPLSKYLASVKQFGGIAVVVARKK